MWCKVFKTPIPLCKNRPKDVVAIFSYNILYLLSEIGAVPVVLFFTANLETVIQREGLMSIPVRQLYTEDVLPLAGQQVNMLVPQPVLCGQTPKALQ